MRRVARGFGGGLVASAFLTLSIAFAQPPKADAPRPDRSLEDHAVKEEKKGREEASAKKVQADEDQKLLKAQVQELTAHRRPLLLVELQFVRVACGPTKEQRRQIAEEAGRLLEKTVTESAREAQARERKGQAAQAEEPDSWKVTQAGLAIIVKSHLSPEQWARYQEENRKRSAHRKQTGIRNLLVQLDRELSLTKDQRVKIGESLGAHWNDAWYSQEALFDSGSLPKIPDPFVVPFLTKVQSTLWKGLKKEEDPSSLDWGDLVPEFMQGLRAADEIELEKAVGAKSHL